MPEGWANDHVECFTLHVAPDKVNRLQECQEDFSLEDFIDCFERSYLHVPSSYQIRSDIRLPYCTTEVYLQNIDKLYSLLANIFGQQEIDELVKCSDRLGISKEEFRRWLKSNIKNTEVSKQDILDTLSEVLMEAKKNKIGSEEIFETVRKFF